MGENKALLAVAGVRLIDRVVASLRPLTDEIILISNDAETYADLGLSVVADLEPGRGPLMGLYSGLSACTRELAFLLACDMPFVNTALLRRMAAAATDYDIVIPQTTDGLHPLHAVYRRSTCLPAIELALAAGERRMISFHRTMRVRVISEAEVALLDPAGIALMNVNTPDELARAERIAQDFQRSEEIQS